MIKLPNINFVSHRRKPELRGILLLLIEWKCETIEHLTAFINFSHNDIDDPKPNSPLAKTSPCNFSDTAVNWPGENH